MNRSGNPFLKRSTAEFFQEGERAGDYSQFDKFHGYLYAKWPYLYISVGLGEHPLNKILAPVFLTLSKLFGDKNGDHDPGYEWANSYHGKVVPLDEAKNLVTVQEEIEIRNLEHVIPFTKAKDIVMINPERIVALDCPCRVSRKDPCTPLDVCLIVGDPFASFMLEHQPEKSRLISSEEAIQILEEEHNRGHVSHAFFKDAMLNRFYAICNCCACCCGAFQAHQSGTPMLMSSGYTASINPELCAGCGNCIDFCQFSAIDLENGWAAVNQEKCFGCGVCTDICDQGAVQIQLDPTKGEPLEILKLMEAVRRSA